MAGYLQRVRPDAIRERNKVKVKLTNVKRFVLSHLKNLYATQGLLLKEIDQLATRIDPNLYKTMTVFVDPIDGTREFATAQGEYVTILIGYNDGKRQVAVWVAVEWCKYVSSIVGRRVFHRSGEPYRARTWNT